MTLQDDRQTGSRPLEPGHTVLDVDCGTGLCYMAVGRVRSGAGSP